MQDDSIRHQIRERLGSMPTYMMGVGSLVVAVLIGVGPLPGGWWTFLLFLAAFLVGAAVVVVAVAQEKTSSERDSELEKLRTEHTRCENLVLEAVRDAEQDKDEAYAEYIRWLCDDRLSMLINLVADSFAASTKEERSVNAVAARGMLICTTAELVGTSERETRANFFLLQTDANGTKCMKPTPLFYGRGTQSIRVFRAGDRTYDRTMAGKGCFVDAVDRTDSETGEQLDYATYLTLPVREGTGKIYGVLTVDSPTSGDLHQRRDTARMKVLAGLLALTYRAEDMRPMPRSNSASSEVD